MNDIIYINGVKHNCTPLDASFYADTPEMPGIRCSHHNIGSDSVPWLKSGGAVLTSGNLYCLRPTKETP